VLRGASEDLVFTEVHTSSDGINAHANLGVRTGGSTRTSRGDNRRRPAWGRTKRTIRPSVVTKPLAAVRLVNKDGDVIWSTTEESLGAKIPRRQRGRGGQDHGQAQGRFREGAKLK